MAEHGLPNAPQIEELPGGKFRFSTMGPDKKLSVQEFNSKEEAGDAFLRSLEPTLFAKDPSKFAGYRLESEKTQGAIEEGRARIGLAGQQVEASKADVANDAALLPGMIAENAAQAGAATATGNAAIMNAKARQAEVGQTAELNRIKTEAAKEELAYKPRERAIQAANDTAARSAQQAATLNALDTGPKTEPLSTVVDRAVPGIDPLTADEDVPIQPWQEPTTVRNISAGMATAQGGNNEKAVADTQYLLQLPKGQLKIDPNSGEVLTPTGAIIKMTPDAALQLRIARQQAGN
jgi:hypothetical protein